MSGAVSHACRSGYQEWILIRTHVAVALAVRLDEKRVPVATCGYRTWDRSTRSELRAQVPTAPDSHAS